MYDDLSYREFDGEKGEPAELSLFALSYCDHCHEAIAFLKEKNISFRYLFLDTLPSESRGPLLRELKRRTNNELIFPVLETKEETIKGFSKEGWLEALALPAR